MKDEPKIGPQRSQMLRSVFERPFYRTTVQNAFKRFLDAVKPFELHSSFPLCVYEGLQVKVDPVYGQKASFDDLLFYIPREAWSSVFDLISKMMEPPELNPLTEFLWENANEVDTLYDPEDTFDERRSKLKNATFYDWDSLACIAQDRGVDFPKIGKTPSRIISHEVDRIQARIEQVEFRHKEKLQSLIQAREAFAEWRKGKPNQISILEFVTLPIWELAELVEFYEVSRKT